MREGAPDKKVFIGAEICAFVHSLWLFIFITASVTNYLKTDFNNHIIKKEMFIMLLPIYIINNLNTEFNIVFFSFK